MSKIIHNQKNKPAREYQEGQQSPQGSGAPVPQAFDEHGRRLGESMSGMFTGMGVMVQSSIQEFVKQLIDSRALSDSQEQALREVFGVGEGQSVSDTLSEKISAAADKIVDSFAKHLNQELGVKLTEMSKVLQSIDSKNHSAEIMPKIDQAVTSLAQLTEIKESSKHLQSLNQLQSALTNLASSMQSIQAEMASLKAAGPDMIHQGITGALMGMKIRLDVSFDG